jgi:hypothetical protein
MSQGGLFELVAPAEGRRALDAYYTPLPLARQLVRTLPLERGMCVLEPSVGGGSWVRALRELDLGLHITGIDIDAGARGLALCDAAVVDDFLSIGVVGARFDFAIGNPPYDVAERHVRGALDVADNCAMLLRAAFVETDERFDFWRTFRCRHRTSLGQRVPFTGSQPESMHDFFWFDLAWNGPQTWSRMDWR